MLKLATVAATLFGMMWSPANAEMNSATRIGVLNDMSSVYSALRASACGLLRPVRLFSWIDPA